MPETVQALIVLLIAVLPGALFVWGYELNVGKWSLGSPDRLIRFLATSAVFQVAFAPLTYWLWRHFFESGRWRAHTWPPLSLWLAAAAYLAVPYTVGVGAGRFAVGSLWPGGGREPPPQAWDEFFSDHPDGWLRIRMKSGAWVAGAYASDAFASGYPEDRDMLLRPVVEVDEQTGEFVLDEGAVLRTRDRTLYVNGEEIEFFEFVDG